MDVAFAGIVLEQGTHHRKGTYTCGNYVRKNHPDGSAEQHDHQRLGQELHLDVALSGAQGPTQADLTDAFVHRDQHDVHHADATDPESERADEREQHFKSDGDAVNDWTKLVAAEHLEGFGVGWRELLARSNGGEHLRHGSLPKLRGDRLMSPSGSPTRPPVISGIPAMPRCWSCSLSL